MQLGRLGAWYSTDKLGGPQQIKQFVGTVERLGYDTLWYPESRGYDSAVRSPASTRVTPSPRGVAC